jgi:hypothetical protein
MTTMDDLFKEYLRRIEPTDQAVRRASESHNPLRDDLKADKEYGPFVENTMLSGSYGRDTAIFSIKDVDAIIKTSFTLADLQERKEDGETVQECLLRLTQEAIQRTGRAARTRKARRSIHVKLPEDGEDDMPELTMDIVPVRIQAGANADPMTISDRELCQWFDTYPNTQLSDSEKRNKRSKVIGDRRSYKPLVKIFKAWKRVHYRTQKTPKGFILECLTARFHNPGATHWIDAVHDLFQNICDEWPNPDNLPLYPSIPEVPDVSDSSPHMIPIAKEREQAQRVLRKIHRHLELIKQAMEEAEEDLTKSAKTLKRVFGDDCDDICFPLPDDLEESSRSHKSRSDVREAPPFA